MADKNQGYSQQKSDIANRITKIINKNKGNGLFAIPELADDPQLRDVDMNPKSDAEGLIERPSPKLNS